MFWVCLFAILWKNEWKDLDQDLDPVRFLCRIPLHQQVEHFLTFWLLTLEMVTAPESKIINQTVQLEQELKILLDLMDLFHFFSLSRSRSRRSSGLTLFSLFLKVTDHPFSNFCRPFWTLNASVTHTCQLRCKGREDTYLKSTFQPSPVAMSFGYKESDRGRWSTHTVWSSLLLDECQLRWL